MLTVSLLIEILRTKPRLMFWLVTLAQALLWLLVPTLFYSAPPGDVADVVAIGREMSFSSTYGAPLAYWLSDIALRVANGHMIGIYLLAQICIVATYWAVFQLGRSLIGDRQALLAIMLMVGMSVFTVFSPDFGPDTLMTPLWALALLFLWRAAGRGQQLYWFALAAVFVAMLATSPMALLLLALIVLFLVITERGRLAIVNIPALAAGGIVIVAVALLLFTMKQQGISMTAYLPRLRNSAPIGQNIVAWARLLAFVVVALAGAGILVALASNATRARKSEAVAITGSAIDPFARMMVYYFALTPLLVVLASAVVSGKSTIAGIPPLLILSGLAIVIAAGTIIMVHHQRLVGIVWFSLLLAPPVLTALGVLLLPRIFAVDLKMAQPANDIARYFTDNFERRTGQKLGIVGGDPRLARLIALASPSRPRVLNDNGTTAPQLASSKDANEKGAIIVWRATDNAGTPPAAIKMQFPNVVPEIPRAFERTLHGRAPLLRIGWGMIRPQTGTPPQ